MLSKVGVQHIMSFSTSSKGISAGHCSPQTIQPSTRTRTRNWNPNDGRAPDTEALLEASEKSSTKGTVSQSFLESNSFDLSFVLSISSSQIVKEEWRKKGF